MLLDVGGDVADALLCDKANLVKVKNWNAFGRSTPSAKRLAWKRWPRSPTKSHKRLTVPTLRGRCI